MGNVTFVILFYLSRTLSLAVVMVEVTITNHVHRNCILFEWNCN